MKSGRTRYALMAGALAVGGAIAFSAAAPVTAQLESKPAEQVTLTEELGVLRLKIRTSTIEAIFSPGDDGPDIAQRFNRSSQCAVTPNPSDPALLTITANASGPGAAGNNIGVRNSNSCGLLGVPAAIVSQNEILTLSLGSYFDQANPDAEVAISGAELDIAAIHRSNLGVKLDTGTFVTHVLPNNRGSFIDQGLKDNNRVVLVGTTPETSFRTVALKSVPTNVPAALAGVSLNGGGDGTYDQYLSKGLIGELGDKYDTADTIFSLVTETTFADSLSCDDTDPAAAIGAGAALEATVTWTPPNECVDDGVALDFDITDDGVILNKAYLNMTPDEIDALRFQVTIVWEPTTPDGLAREISFTPPFEAESFASVQWCGAEDEDGVPTRPEGVPWCLVSNAEVLLPNGLVAQTQVYDGLGDPMWR